MIAVQFGAATVTEFNVADFFLQSLVSGMQVDITSDLLRLYSDENDYVELRGSFVDPDTTNSKNPLDYVNALTSYKFVANGKTNYAVSGLELDGDTLSSLGRLAKYLDRSEYKIIGNDGANKVSSGSGEDLLNGGKGNDALIGNGGDDYLVGGAGRDAFIFFEGDGEDVIKDFTAVGKDADVLDLSDYGDKLNFKALDISRDGKHDVLIEIGKGGDEILLEDVNIKQITAADFDF